MKTLELTDEEASALAMWIDHNMDGVREDAYYGEEPSRQTMEFLDSIIERLTA